MNRRSLLAATGGAIGAGHLAGCGGASVPPRGSPAAPAPAAATSAPHAELEEVTIAELSEKMKKGEIDAASLVDHYLARIEALDRSGPLLSSVIELDPDARAIAERLDAERRERGPRGPLHGIPLLLKDNIDTAGRTHTTAGSLALAGPPAPLDADVAARLRKAGAIILGKTNLSEWANMRSTHSTCAWSATGGITRNPYALDRSPSGSSCGSAAAVAANLAAAALGTETDGSILSPSSVCGIVGIKPTLGLVSRAGIVPIAHSQDTAGPMARSVADAAILLGALAGFEARDPATAAARGRAIPDYTASLRPGGARGKRIGVLRAIEGLPRSVLPILDAAVEELRRLGAVVVDPATLDNVAKLSEPEFEVLLYEFKADLAAYFATRPGAPVKSIADLVRFNREHEKDELRYFGQEFLEQAMEKGPLDSPAYTQAVAACRRFSREEGIDRALREQKLDLLLAPTAGPAWLTDLVNGDSFTGGSFGPAAVAGYPSISVPAGALHGLPVGISFIGPAFSEPLLIAVAYDYERASRRRAKPRFLPTLEPF